MAKNLKQKKENDHLLPQDHPMAKRKTVAKLEDEEGEVVVLDDANFGIRTPARNDTLLALNLPAEWQKSGARIRFSGKVKETELSEFWAGQPVLLTKIDKA